MKDPQRLLLDGGASDIERRLLEAGIAEEPSERSIRTAAAAIGLGVAAGLTSHAAGAGTASVIAQLAMAAKWGGFGLLGVGVVVAVGYVAVTQSSGQAVIAPPGQSAPPIARATGASKKPPVRHVSSQGRKTEAKTPASATPSLSPRPRASSTRSTLKDQIVVVDEARQKLASGDPHAALAALDQYQREYPQGAFGQEAMLLRIEALAQMGNQSAARSLAARFLRNQPDSPHRKRIESVIGKVEISGPR